MSIAEPLYLVTRRRTRIKGVDLILAALHVSDERGNATAEALRLCEKGIPTVVYQCKLVEVHHPTKQALRERRKRLDK